MSRSRASTSASSGPLGECLCLGEALANTRDHQAKIFRDYAVSPGGNPLQGRAQRVAGREQHSQLLGNHRQLEEEATLSFLRSRRHVLLLHEEGEDRRPDDEKKGDHEWGLDGNGEQRRQATDRQAHPDLAGSERGDIEGRVDPAKADRELLADSEGAGQ